MSVSIEEFQALLDKHDWNYMYSDDYSVWSRGQRSFKALQNLCRDNLELRLMLERKIKEVQ